MTFRLIFFVTCYFLSFTAIVSGQSIRLNEIQASNTIYQDEDQDTPDWIELYNASGAPINIEGWSLTDDLDKETFWTFDNTVIPANIYGYLWASGKDRKDAGVARSLVREDHIFRYIVPTQGQGSAWKDTGYDDSNWSLGQGGFGYGDGDDVTTVPNGTRSVFIRKEFNIEDVNKITDLYLDIDYDDAFVAFINGVEIARDNINGSIPIYLSLANTDKEAKMYNGDAPDNYNLSDFISLLNDGANVLALQVHNNVNTSSDMTLRPFLTARYNANTQDGATVHPLLEYTSSRWHTDFKISSASETIYLIEPDGSIHDSLVITDLPTDMSYGYTPTGELAYFDNPTPGMINSNISYMGILTGEVQFSNDGGQVDPFTLALTTTVDAAIRYTSDGTEPTIQSTLFNTPINLSNTTSIRAKLFKNGYFTPKVHSRNYIIGEDHLLPVVSLITDPVHLFDEEEGIYSYGNNFSNEFPFFGANFWDDEERPIHISYYGEDNELKFDLDAGVKIFGGWSRAFDQRSLSLFARNKYGPKDIEYPIFEERDYPSYGAMVLRNAGNDIFTSNMRDIIVHDLTYDLDLESQAYQSVAAYINEEYWGMYHLREKVNEHFLAQKFDIDPETIDLLEFDSQVIQGTNEDYLTLLNLINNGDLTNPDVYNEVKDKMDIDNFLDYYAIQIYINNTDWPGNNNKYWRHPDGKWRWILYDTDFGFNLFEEFGHQRNTLQFALEDNGPNWPNPPWATQLLRGLVQNENFRIDLVNRFADFMNSRFLTEHIIETIDNKIDLLQPEIIRHFERWQGNLGNWNHHIDRMKSFATLRPNLMKNHIRDVFDLPATHTINIVNNETDKGFVEVSTLTVRDANWSGDYFEGNPFSVKAIAKPGYEFSHWSGSLNSSSSTIEINLPNPITLVANFTTAVINEPLIVINEINYKSSDLNDADDWIELHNPSTIDIELSNWIITDDNEDHEFIIPETILSAGDFLVIVRDENKFTSLHSDVAIISGLGFGLGSNDQVKLYNNDNELMDSVSYSNMSPWPIGANGNGYTLELINPTLDNSLAESYDGININGSPGKQNVLPTSTNNPSSIITQSTVYPNPTTEVLTIEIKVIQSSDIDIKVLDQLGRVVLSKNGMKLSKGNNEIILDINSLSEGHYILSASNDSGTQTNMPFVKIK